MRPSAFGSTAPNFSHVRRCLLPAVRAQRRVVEMQEEGQQSMLPMFHVKQLIELATALQQVCNTQRERSTANKAWWVETATATLDVRDRLTRACSDVVSSTVPELATIPTTSGDDLKLKESYRKKSEPSAKPTTSPLLGQHVSASAVQPPASARPGKRSRSYMKGPTSPLTAIGMTGSAVGIQHGIEGEPPKTPAMKQIKLASGAAIPSFGPQGVPTISMVRPQMLPMSAVTPGQLTGMPSPGIGAIHTGPITTRRRIQSSLDFPRGYGVTGAPYGLQTTGPETDVLGTTTPREALRVSAPSPRFLSHPISLPTASVSSSTLLDHSGGTAGASAGGPMASLGQLQPLTSGTAAGVARPMSSSMAATAAAQQYFMPLTAAGYYQSSAGPYGYMYGPPTAPGYPLVPATYSTAPQLYYGIANPYTSLLQGGMTVYTPGIFPTSMTGAPPQTLGSPAGHQPGRPHPAGNQRQGGAGGPRNSTGSH